MTALVVWTGLPLSVAPAEERHPYGYGKSEASSGIAASLALLAAAGVIAYQSVREIVIGVPGPPGRPHPDR